MTTFSAPAAPGATGDKFVVKDHVGELLLINVIDAKRIEGTEYGDADAIACVVGTDNLELGLRFAASKDWDVVVDARYIDISADVSVNGTNVGEASVDPMVYSIMLGKRF
jgi:hypothetical protein